MDCCGLMIAIHRQSTTRPKTFDLSTFAIRPCLGTSVSVPLES
ncbi:hypothetical protein BIFDEN_02428 [Bifidobacterium dentium ATCC 27678]|nr:hypothetical protein BIFDEN_02428 [Bifidobacterium dentium ATCC 27678]